MRAQRDNVEVGSIKRYLYTIDPALNITNTLVRTLWAMTLLYTLPVLLLPQLGIPGLMGVGAGSTFMTLVPELIQARTRRELSIKGLYGSLGTLCGAAITLALHGRFVAQIAFFVLLLCMPFWGARYSKKYLMIFVNSMVGATLMSMLIGNYLKDPWLFFRALVVLVVSCVMLMVLVFGLVIRRPTTVLQSAKKSLYLSHEQCARLMVRYLNSGSKRSWRQLQHCLARVHRGAVALEAAMVDCPGFPAELGETLHHCAYDTDLLLTRTARIVARLMPPGLHYANPGNVSRSHEGEPLNVWMQRLARRLAQIFTLLQDRDPANLELATELVGELRGELVQLRPHLSEEEFTLYSRLPVFLADLLSETVDGGMASAEADAWIWKHRLARRERALAQMELSLQSQGRSPRQRIWRSLVPLRKFVWHLRMTDSNTWHIDPVRSSWVPVDTAVLEALRYHETLSSIDGLPKEDTNLADIRDPHTVSGFTTGISYADLRYSGENAAAAHVIGEKKIGPVVIGLGERQALQTLCAVSVASVIGWVIAREHFFWASFGAYVVLLGTTTTSSRYRKMFKRVIGTVIGAVIGLSLTFVIGLLGVDSPLFFGSAIACTIVLASVAFTVTRINYTLFCVLLTALVMQIYLITAMPLLTFALMRVIDNIIGTVVAVFVAQFVFPLHTSQVVQELMHKLGVALEETLRGVQGVLNGDLSARPRVSARQVEYAGNDIRNLAAALLGPFVSTSDSWIRRVASRLPALISATTQVAATAGDIRDDWDLSQPIPAPSKAGREVAKLAGEVADFSKELLVVPADGGLLPDRSLGKISQLVFQSQSLLDRINSEERASQAAALSETASASADEGTESVMTSGNANPECLRDIVYQLATLDAALKKLLSARKS